MPSQWLISRRCALATLALSAISCRRRDPAPLLVVGPRREPLTNGVASLVVGSLPVDAREAVADRFESIAEAIEARNNPFLFNLDEIDVDSAIAEARPMILPMITAAARLAATYFPLDEVSSVSLGTSCAKGEICVPAWGPSDHPRTAAARFAAWPIAHAFIVRMDGQTHADTAGAALRSATAQRQSPIALVVSKASLTTTTESATRVAKASARCVRLLKDNRSAAAALAPLAGDPTPPQLLGLSLRDDELLIVPKLGALAERPRFRAAIADRLATSGVDRHADLRGRE